MTRDEKADELPTKAVRPPRWPMAWSWMGRRCVALSLLPAALGTLLAVQTGCAPGRALPREGDVGGARFEYEEPQMGLPFRIVLFAPDRATADAAARAAFDRVARLNAILSDYDSDSELSRLSQTAGTGRSVPVSADLWCVLAAAQAWARASEGAFDVTVGPYVNLWRKARRDRQFPDPSWLESARLAVGHEKLELDARRRTARLLVPGMRLDLGGIAKGFALDEALKVLQSRGVRRALVSGGGDMVAGEPPPGRAGWTVTLAPMDGVPAGPAPVVLLARAALATSGDTFQRLEIDGQRYSHIVDPRTGIGLTRPSLVTVIARDGMTADALATAASVLGPGAGRRLVRTVKGAAVRMVYRAGGGLEAEESPGFKKFYELDDRPAGAHGVIQRSRGHDFRQRETKPAGIDGWLRKVTTRGPTQRRHQEVTDEHQPATGGGGEGTLGQPQPQMPSIAGQEDGQPRSHPDGQHPARMTAPHRTEEGGEVNPMKDVGEQCHGHRHTRCARPGEPWASQ